MVSLFTEQLEATLALKSAEFDQLMAYFTTNWFTEAWRCMWSHICILVLSSVFIDMWTDMGIPSGQNRDRMLNTNNWVESSFRVFDKLFLHARANKRYVHSEYCRNKSNILNSIDRLVLIIKEFLTFYETWEPNHETRNRTVIQELSEGHLIWQQPGMIVPLGKTSWNVADFKQVLFFLFSPQPC